MKPNGASALSKWHLTDDLIGQGAGSDDAVPFPTPPATTPFTFNPQAYSPAGDASGVVGGIAPTAMLDNGPPPELSGGALLDSTVGSGGATAVQVQQALDEGGLNVNGAGIKVGVLSDSFNDLGGAAADEADGALPPASDIQVLKDLSSGGTDEGRAMMQIIHDIAPGASLAFYTAFDSEQDFANGILALAAAGSKVIVDDVSYFDEPMFQNGVIAQAIQTVEAEGVTYVTAAGNEGSDGYQASWTPIANATYDGFPLSDTENFGGSPVQTITVGGETPLVLEWNQPYGAATSNLEMLVFQNDSLVALDESALDEPGNPFLEVDLPSAGTYEVAVENLSGSNPGLIKEITFGDGIFADINGANVGTVFGHAMTPGAITVGAVSAADTPAFGVTPPISEYFSSSGAGTELLFDDDGNALSSPDLLSPVAVSGIDDIHTTVPGGLSDFYGTSAASASLAGVAALILSADPTLTAAQVEQIMEQTALPMSDPAVSGAGLVQVDAAVAEVDHQIFTVNGTTTEALQGGPAVALLGGAPVITDSQSTTLASATISIANGSGVSIAGDALFVAGQQTGTVDGGAVGVSWNASIATLTLTGTASLAAYQTLLDAVTYQDTGTDSSTGSHPVRTVTWTVNDGTQNLESTSLVTIDRPPVAGNATAVDPLGSTLTVNATSGVLSYDSDPDDDTLSVLSVDGQADEVGVAVAGAYGDLTLNASGGYTYIPDAGAAAGDVDSFSYVVSDGNGGTASATLRITLTFLDEVGTGDFNHSADADIVFQGGGGAPLFWIMNGTSATAITEPSPGASLQLVATGDFNGDGNSDLLFQNLNGTPTIWLMNGTTLISTATLANPTASWQIVGTGDVTDAGHSESILFQNNDGQPAIWVMNGSNVVNSYALANPGPSWQMIGSGDFFNTVFFNNDILWQNVNGTPAIWEMNGGTIVNAFVLPDPTVSFHIIGAGDFAGDGHNDSILFQNNDGQPAIWVMNGSTIVNEFALPNPGPSWQITAIGDFNGDGNSDIFWQNTANGQDAVWLMNGGTVLSAQLVTASASGQLGADSAAYTPYAASQTIAATPGVTGTDSTSTLLAATLAPITLINSRT